VTIVAAGQVHGHPGTDALRLEAGRIVEIGRAASMTGLRLDHPGATILPAFRDSHVHPVGMAATKTQLDVSGAADLDELIQLISARARVAAESEAIVVTGVDEERLADKRLPTAADLDKASAVLPILAFRHCSHVAVANSRAMRAAGIDRSTPDPPEGRIVRASSGAPTGVLEEGAIRLVSDHLSASLPAEDPAAIGAVLHELRRRGVVAIDAMVSSGSSMWCAGSDELATLCAAGPSSPIGVDVFVICDTPEELRRAAEMVRESGPRIRFAGWKGFADGSLGGRTAALRAPYADDPSTSGMLLGSGLDTMTEAALELGGQVAIHAIGDKAVDLALGLAEKHPPGVVRIEHASVADPHQIARMASSGAIASIQPSFATVDAPWLERRLGKGRSDWAYPFASMVANGVTVRGGSDAPIESSDPLIGIRDAHARRTEALDHSQAVAIYAAHPLEVGAPATFTVCSDGAVDEVWMEGTRT
jgi:hypothetical protein